MDRTEIEARSAHLRELMRSHLGVRGKTLEASLRHAGRRLPKRLRAAGQVLVEAERLSDNPRLAVRVDPARAEAAYRDIAAHLQAIDRRQARIGAVLGVLGDLAFNALILAGVTVAVLVWRGVL